MDFIKVGSACPKTKVADVIYNVENICSCIDESYNKEVKFIVFPELCVTSYTCGDLFLQETLLESAKRSLIKICNESLKYKNMLIFAGLPFEYNSKLYNVAAATL